MSVSDAFVVCFTSCSIKNTDVFSPIRCAIFHLFTASSFYCSALFEMVLSAEPELWVRHEFQCSGTPVFSLLLSILLIINVAHAVFLWYFFQFLWIYEFSSMGGTDQLRTCNFNMMFNTYLLSFEFQLPF